MATNFPTSLDSYTNVADGDTIQISTTNNQQDAIEALEAKVGIDSSADTDSHDYKINTLETWKSAITATTSEINILDGVTATTSEINILDGVTATASEINLLDGYVDSAFRAYVNTMQSNVTGDGTPYYITGSFFTERFDNGGDFSDGTFTAPVTSNKYKFGISIVIGGTSSSHSALLSLVTTSATYNICNVKPYNLLPSGSVVILSFSVDNIPMTAADTAKWMIVVSEGTKTIDINGYTEVWGGLSL